MIKENKNIDFLTTGREPSEEDFARISEWIKRDKQKQATHKATKKPLRKNPLAQQQSILRKWDGK